MLTSLVISYLITSTSFPKIKLGETSRNIEANTSLIFEFWNYWKWIRFQKYEKNEVSPEKEGADGKNEKTTSINPQTSPLLA